jgi:hypothetical protein
VLRCWNAAVAEEAEGESSDAIIEPAPSVLAYQDTRRNASSVPGPAAVKPAKS